jgi:membrane protein DedA with SNARE-associated domain
MIRHGLEVLFFWVLAEQLGVPIPALPALLAAGALARIEGVNPLAPLLVAMSASIFADGVWYEIGVRRGGKVMRLLCRISLEPDSCVRRTEDAFLRHGARSLVFAKFIPGLSMAAPPLAGVIGMRFSRFMGYTALGAFLWAGSQIAIGYVFSDQLEAIAKAIASIASGLQIALGVIVVYVFLKWFNRHRFLRSIRTARIRPEELKARLDAGDKVVIVDLRSSVDVDDDFETIPGAVRIAKDDLVRQHTRIARDRDVILFCT